MDASPPAAKTEPVPPPKGLGAVWNHLKNWQEVYLFLPLSLFAIWAFAQFGYFLTGRRPTENVDWIVGLAGNLVKCVCLIVLLSILREQTGTWLSKEEQMNNPNLVKWQTCGQCVALLAFAYLLNH